MKIETISPDKFDMVYPLIMSLSSLIAKSGKTIFLIDFTNDSQINKILERNYGSSPLKGHYHEKVGGGVVYYVNMPVALSKADEIRVLIKILYKEISSIEAEIKVILFPTSIEITQQMLYVEREMYRKVFGPDESRSALVLGVQRVILSDEPESPRLLELIPQAHM